MLILNQIYFQNYRFVQSNHWLFSFHLYFKKWNFYIIINMLLDLIELEIHLR